MKKVLIFNAFPTNNGDAALVFSLFSAFKNKGFNVKIAAQKYDLISSLYKGYPLVRELTDYEIFNKVPGSRYIKSLFTPLMFLFSKEFMKADVLVASPGGYINSYYGFSRVSATIFTAKLLGKKTAIYSQSFGPFNKRDEFLIKFISRFTDILYARDKYSYETLMNLKIKKERVHLVEDGAFLIPFKSTVGNARKIAVSVRSWKHDLRNQSIFFDMIKKFVIECVDRGYSIEFVSTCQGLENYIDDSKVAEEIKSSLPTEYLSKVEVNHDYFRLEELQSYIEQFDAVIGTRLHMCILSLLRGKPCLNISYEIKGKEAFEYLGLSDYSVDYNEDLNIAGKRIVHFLETLPSYKQKIDEIMPSQNNKANTYFDNFVNILFNKRTAS